MPIQEHIQNSATETGECCTILECPWGDYMDMDMDTFLVMYVDRRERRALILHSNSILVLKGPRTGYYLYSWWPWQFTHCGSCCAELRSS